MTLRPRISPSGPLAPVSDPGSPSQFNVSTNAPGAAVRQNINVAGPANPLFSVVDNAVVVAESGRYLITLCGGKVTGGSGGAVLNLGSTLFAAHRSITIADAEDWAPGWSITLVLEAGDEVFVTATSNPAPPSWFSSYLQLTKL